MVTIDPNTLAVGPGSGGRGLALLLAAVLFGFGATGWFTARAASLDDDFLCVEDERGVCGPSALPGHAFELQDQDQDEDLFVDPADEPADDVDDHDDDDNDNDSYVLPVELVAVPKPSAD